jgi:hypothetical protein
MKRRESDTGLWWSRNLRNRDSPVEPSRPQETEFQAHPWRAVKLLRKDHKQRLR